MRLADAQRQAIVTEARTWVGTPYRGHSCVKGAGADCGQLLYGIYRAAGVVPDVELPRDYALQVSQHQASQEYVDFVRRFCDEIPEAEAKPGDLVLYKLGLSFSHGGLIVWWPDFVIHTEYVHGVCATHGTKSGMLRRLGRSAERSFWTLRGAQ